MIAVICLNTVRPPGWQGRIPAQLFHTPEAAGSESLGDAYSVFPRLQPPKKSFDQRGGLWGRIGHEGEPEMAGPNLNTLAAVGRKVTMRAVIESPQTSQEFPFTESVIQVVEEFYTKMNATVVHPLRSHIAKRRAPALVNQILQS